MNLELSVKIALIICQPIGKINMSEKIINFPKDKIVRNPENLNAQKPKGFHQKKIEELLWQLEYEFLKGHEAKEFDLNTEFQYHKILPIRREDQMFTKLMVVIYPTTHLL